MPNGVRAKSPRAKVEDVRLHDLKNAFASRVVLQSASPPVATKLLGHEDVSTTPRYADVSSKDVEAVAEQS